MHPTYGTADVDGFEVFYREAGDSHGAIQWSDLKHEPLLLPPRLPAIPGDAAT
jgi:hypothetical protein